MIGAVRSAREAAPSWARASCADGRPLVVAHRGASHDAPENTLAAFRRARLVGADAVELDVMRCASGEIVVFHDDDLVRLGGRRERVRQLPLAALREVDVARALARPFRDGGTGIPTLDEVLDELGPRMRVNVELKAVQQRLRDYLDVAPEFAAVDAVADLLRRRGDTARFLVSSFDPFLLARFRRVAPGIATAFLFGRDEALPVRLGWPGLLVGAAALHPEAALVDARALRRWRRLAAQVNVWTVDDPHEIACLAVLGVDGIITNQPDVARAALEAT